MRRTFFCHLMDCHSFRYVQGVYKAAVLWKSTRQHKHHIIYWREHFVFNNIQGCKRGTAYTDSVLSDILDIEGGNAVPKFGMTYKIFWSKIKPTKIKNSLTGSDAEIFIGVGNGGGWWLRFNLHFFQGWPRINFKIYEECNFHIVQWKFS